MKRGLLNSLPLLNSCQKPLQAFYDNAHVSLPCPWVSRCRRTVGQALSLCGVYSWVARKHELMFDVSRHPEDNEGRIVGCP